MNIDNYRSKIIQIRKALGENHIDKVRANFLWDVYKTIPDTNFNQAVESYLLDQSLTLETHIDKAIDAEKDLEKEEIKQTYIKPVFTAPIDSKPRVFCCDYGTVFARKIEDQCLYVFKCNCMAGRYASPKYETWANQNGFEKVS